MIANPPIMPQDSEILAIMEIEYGLVPGQPWDFSSLSSVQ